MVFRAVVMETQAVSHTQISEIRHILSHTFSQKRMGWFSPKDQKHLLSESRVVTERWYTHTDIFI